ncbi:MAG TPA: AMP-binding protein [Gemmataceae bacterium]|nr:AMP-binding protein [Gemmataceae bacterium]
MTDAQHPWVDGLTFAEVLRQTAEPHGDRDALVFPWLKYRRSYAEFRTDVRRVARALMALGVRRGENVGIWATNWPQWVIVQFAAAEVGAVLVNVNPAYRAHELRYVLQQADVTALLLTDRYKTSQYFDLLAEVCPELVSCPPGRLRSAACLRLRQVVSIQEAKHPGMLGWGEFLARADEVSETELDRRAADLGPQDVVNIQYTSGTTGFPKGAMLTHRNLLMNAFYVGQRMGFSERDRLCIPVPFYHCFGCVMGTLTCAIYGAAMVVPAESFDPLATLQAIQDEACTAVYGVPTMFIAELNHPRFAEFDLRSLRTGVMAGSPCPVEVMRAVGERMGARELTIGYGLTEASPILTQTATSDDLEHRVGTVGRPIPGVEVRVVAPGSLDPLPPGQQGELMGRGHGIMKGYYNKPAETAAAITPDGWLHSGDLALQTPDGYYRITGRIKDMIIRGGENVYPREIEEYLHTHPAVLDVQVVGLPDERYGEEVCAWVRLRPGASLTEEQLKDFCRGRIAHYKVPRYVVFVEDYPTTVTGKVQKFRLRELGVERFGLRKAANVETA